METTRTDLTFAYIKPENGMANEKKIIKIITKAGFTIRATKRYQFTEEIAKKFYKEHMGKDFYNVLIEFTCSEEVRVFLLQKENAVQAWRDFIGATKNPTEGTLRHTFQIPNPGHKNVVHGSDSNENAKRETSLVFPCYEPFFY